RGDPGSRQARDEEKVGEGECDGLLVERPDVEFAGAKTAGIRLAAQAKQRLIQRQGLAVRGDGPLLPAQPASLEGGRRLRIGNGRAAGRIRKRTKGAELRPASFGHLPAELLMMIGEVQERRPGRPFLA